MFIYRHNFRNQHNPYRARRVYDWVFDAITIDTRINLPPAFRETVALAVTEERTLLDAICKVPEVPGFFPLDSQQDTNENMSCTVSSNIERRETLVNGVRMDLAIVRVIFTIRPLITIMDSEGEVVGQFRPTISKSHRLVVCVPESFTADNVLCRIIDINCETNLIETGVPDMDLQIALDICFEIQAEADVKLEVLATSFCFPRPNDIEIPTEGVCPTLKWPESCHFFPRKN